VLRFIADASLRGVYVRALRRAFPEIDLVTAHEVGLRESPDERILEYAATHGRIAISQDYATMADFAYARVAERRGMSGLIQVPLDGPVAPVIEDFRLILSASQPADWRDRVIYLPL